MLRLADLHQRRLLAELQGELGKALFDRERPAQDIAQSLETKVSQVQTTVREAAAGRLLPAGTLPSRS